MVMVKIYRFNSKLSQVYLEKGNDRKLKGEKEWKKEKY